VDLYLRFPSTPSWHGAQLKGQGRFMGYLESSDTDVKVAEGLVVRFKDCLVIFLEGLRKATKTCHDILSPGWISIQDLPNRKQVFVCVRVISRIVIAVTGFMYTYILATLQRSQWLDCS
jgi:hypothetical protein